MSLQPSCDASAHVCLFLVSYFNGDYKRMQEIAVTNAMVAFLVALAQNVLPNATADVAIPSNFTVCLHSTELAMFAQPSPQQQPVVMAALDIFFTP